MATANPVPPLPSELVAIFTASPELPTPLPADPFPTLRAWFDEEIAAKRSPNPDAMSLATIDADGTPSNRIVLCRRMNAEEGFVTFFTNYEGRKGRALRHTSRAAVCFHWDHSDRQARIEGEVVVSPPAESDEYFLSRRWESRLSAWTSRQSTPTSGRGELLEHMRGVLRDLGIPPEDIIRLRDQAPIPRPPNWGGFRLYARSVELWLGGTGRLHDRAVWTRTLRRDADRVIGSAWSATRLQP